MACHSDGIASETAGSTAERTPSCNLGDKKTCQAVVEEGEKHAPLWRFLPEVQCIDRTDRHSVRA